MSTAPAQLEALMTAPVDVSLPARKASRSPREAIGDLGFDPATVQTVILTPTSAVAIAADYPEPYIPPEA